MAWFDTYTAAPAVITEYEAARDYYVRVSWSGLVISRYSRLEEVTTTEYRGLTYTAAKAAADTEADTGTQVSVRRNNPAGGYTFTKSTTIVGNWTEYT